jgi:hypothetical protein
LKQLDESFKVSPIKLQEDIDLLFFLLGAHLFQQLQSLAELALIICLLHLLHDAFHSPLKLTHKLLGVAMVLAGTLHLDIRHHLPVHLAERNFIQVDGERRLTLKDALQSLSPFLLGRRVYYCHRLAPEALQDLLLIVQEILIHVVEGDEHVGLAVATVALAIPELPVAEEVLKLAQTSVLVLAQPEDEHAEFEEVLGLRDPADLLQQSRLASVVIPQDLNAPLAVDQSVEGLVYLLTSPHVLIVVFVVEVML